MLPSITNRRFFPSIVEDLFNDDLFPGLVRNNTGITIPAVNIVELKDDYRIEVAAPGLDKNDFRIEVEENVLVISSEKEEKKEENDERYTRKEFSYSSFRRTFTLPEGVNKDKIKASHKDGILAIIIPKEDAEKSRFKKMIKIG